MPVTTISSRFCQRERSRSGGKFARDEFRTDGQHQHQPPGEHDGGVEFEKAVLPEDDIVGAKMHDGPPAPWRLVFSRRPRQPRYDDARHDKSEEAQQQPLPMTARDKIKAGQRNAHAQQQTAEKPKRRPFGRNTPDAPSTKDRRKTPRRAKQPAAKANTRVKDSFIALSSCSSDFPVFLGHPMPRVEATETKPTASSMSVQECPPGWCSSSQSPSAAPSSVGTATDQPTMPIMPRPDQTLCVT